MDFDRKESAAYLANLLAKAASRALQARADGNGFAPGQFPVLLELWGGDGLTQRELLDRLSAAVAQFGPDQELVFANLPFRRLFAIGADEVAEARSFARLLDAWRDLAGRGAGWTKRARQSLAAAPARQRELVLRFERAAGLK